MDPLSHPSYKSTNLTPTSIASLVCGVKKSPVSGLTAVLGSKASARFTKALTVGLGRI